MTGHAEDEETEGYWPFGWEAPDAPQPSCAQRPAAAPVRPPRRRRDVHTGTAVIWRARARQQISARPWRRWLVVHAAGRRQDLALLSLTVLVTVLVWFALS